MQETRHDGSEVITRQATPEEIEQALINPNNKSVGIYPVGSVMTIAGTEYIADHNGSLRRKNPTK